MKPDWRLQLRLLSARILIKLGKLSHADYTPAQLTEAINLHLPETFKVDVPISKGELTLLKAKVSMPSQHKAINVDLLGSIIIGPVGTPIYRAHVSLKLDVYPIFDIASKTVKVDKMIARDVQLVNDQYAIVQDSRELLSLLLPKPLQSLLSDSVKSAIGFMTAGGSDLAANYMKLYLSGSKQRILDYHKPQIEALVHEFAQRDDLKYRIGSDTFEELVFQHYGKAVVVEDGHLRFKF